MYSNRLKFNSCSDSMKIRRNVCAPSLCRLDNGEEHGGAAQPLRSPQPCFASCPSRERREKRS